MEENLDKNAEVNKKISDNTTNSYSQEIKEPRLKKDQSNLNENNIDDWDNADNDW